MKLLPVLLGVSLAVNTAWVVTIFRNETKHERPSSAVSIESDKADVARRVMEARVPAKGEGKSIATALNRGDAEALRDELRAAGVEEEFIRMIVNSRLWKSR